ncbi:MAG TPA: AbrB/MazE/SpoVT family DNA-binding domain-containing protein [Rickettsia endosymbiont of Pyrocoelia pectoralis]|nr:AbrB/MazE/SpoVT family DNA-binding domain-containing protein [Rickettsia endosymbiont of Pyrocoelia pectoralis]
MKTHDVSLTNRGQITIPIYIREKLNLSTGSKLELIVQDNSLMVIPINKSIRNLKNILPKPKNTLTINEMNEIIKGSHDRN